MPWRRLAPHPVRARKCGRDDHPLAATRSSLRPENSTEQSAWKKLLKALLKAIRMLYRCWLLNAWQANANMKKGACLMYASYQHSTVLQYLIFILSRCTFTTCATFYHNGINVKSTFKIFQFSSVSLFGWSRTNGGSATATDPPRQDATAKVKPANSKHPGLLH